MQIDKEKLEGYRRPTVKEREGITKYLKTNFSAELRVMAFWSAVCSVLAGGFFLNLVLDIHPGDRKEDVICLVFFCITAFIVFQIRLSRKKKKSLLRSITEGDYKVLECRAYEVKFDISLTGQAEVQIFNKKGQYCRTNFLIDETTAKRCKAGEEIKLLLLKCGEDFYELLSEQRMGVSIDELN